MASRWTDCVIQQAIVESAQCLGYSSVREVQAKAIRSVVAGKDVFISLPTGSGTEKSALCFQVCPCTIGVLLSTWPLQKRCRDKHSDSSIPSYCSNEGSGMKVSYGQHC